MKQTQARRSQCRNFAVLCPYRYRRPYISLLMKIFIRIKHIFILYTIFGRLSMKIFMENTKKSAYSISVLRLFNKPFYSVKTASVFSAVRFFAYAYTAAAATVIIAAVPKIFDSIDSTLFTALHFIKAAEPRVVL